MDKEIMKMWYTSQWDFVHLEDKNEMVKTLCKWMDLISVALGEVTRSRKTKLCILSHMCMLALNL